MKKVFISYRRDDSQWPADKLFETIKSCGEEVFMDIHGINAGTDYVEVLRSKVAKCDVLLALIGPRWLNAQNSQTHARRLDDPNDFVRIEIAAALNRNIRVVPVLLDGTPMPIATELPDELQPLSRRNAVEVRIASFNDDARRMLEDLGIHVPNRSLRTFLIGGAAVAAAAAAGGASVILRWPPQLYGLPAFLQDAVNNAEAARAQALRISREADNARIAAEQEKARAYAAAADERWEIGAQQSGAGHYAGDRRGVNQNALGVFETPSGAKYAGNWHGFTYDGAGVYQDDTADGVIKSIGRFTANVLIGPGELRYRNRSQFLGTVVANEPSGFGVMIRGNGHELLGEFVSGKLEGPGIERDSNGVVTRKGVWRNGVLNDAREQTLGRDVESAVTRARAAERQAMQISERGRQSADLAQELAARARASHNPAEEGLQHIPFTAGYGEYAGQPRTFDGALGVFNRADGGNSGDVYAGAWTEEGGDFAHVIYFGGFGVYTFPPTSPDVKSRQIGFFEADKQAQQGTIEFRDGRLYRGDVREDMATGFGVTTLPNGTQRVGSHIDGALEGPGIEFDSHGAVARHGHWRAGQLVRET